MRKMVYLPYVRFEQEEGEAEGIGWYFTQYNAETGEVHAGLSLLSCGCLILRRWNTGN